ncbi:porin [Acidovorax sp. LjRoot66]|uniref:porin n=1 Tax=Acidovorax sp. LjRoot66 TaxID=3342334 RepID=UPI003ECE110D
MKKHTIAFAATLAAAGPALAQTSGVQIYGIADVGVAYVGTVQAPTTAAPKNTGSGWLQDSGLLQASRLGFRGTEDLGGGLRAQFGLEGGLAIDSGSFSQGGLPFGRRSTVGLAGWIGDLQIGRRKDFTDEIAEPFSSITPFGTFITRVHSNNMDRIGGNRANNMVYYSTPRWNGFRANVTYGLGETADSTATGQSFGAGAIYNTEGFGAGVGYWQSKLGVVTATANSSSDQGAATGAGCNTVGMGQPGEVCMRTWIVGARYKTGGLHLHGSFSRVNQPLVRTGAGAAPNFAANFTRPTGTQPFTAGGPNNPSSNIADLGVEYAMGVWLLKGSFIQSRYNFIGAASKGKLTQYTAGAEYRLSKRTTLYATVAHLKADAMYSPGIIGPAPGAGNATTALGTGIRHTF